MCTINDEDEEISLMEEKETFKNVESNCRKCLENEAEVILRGKDPYCRSCFVVYATHKFRALLGKSKLVRKGDKVLVGFSGSASSLALLHLIKAGLGEETHKKLVFQPFVVYIYEAGAFNQNYEKLCKTVEEVSNLLKQFNFVSYISYLESIFHSDGDSICYDINSEIPAVSKSRLSQLFSKVNCSSSKEELLIKLRSNLLLKIASELKCNKILTGETLVTTASKLLSNISLGRGAQLAFDIGFCDSREKDIKILRPMQDFSKEEIDFYCKIHSLKSFRNFYESDSNRSTSIQVLTRKFVDELQENFPSTLSTIYRTGSKLTIESKSAEAMEKCPLCKGPLDTDVSESSSLQATVYSGLISKGRTLSSCSDAETDKTINSTSVSCNGKIDGCHCSKAGQENSISKDEVSSALCYGCRLIINDMGSVEMLPNDVLKSVAENSLLKQMKKEIDEFLL